MSRSEPNSHHRIHTDVPIHFNGIFVAKPEFDGGSYLGAPKTLRFPESGKEFEKPAGEIGPMWGTDQLWH